MCCLVSLPLVFGSAPNTVFARYFHQQAKIRFKDSEVLEAAKNAKYNIHDSRYGLVGLPNYIFASKHHFKHLTPFNETNCRFENMVKYIDLLNDIVTSGDSNNNIYSSQVFVAIQKFFTLDFKDFQWSDRKY